MKTMTKTGALTVYPESIGVHPDLKVFIRSDGAVWMKRPGRSTFWNWTYGSPDADGYPRVKIQGKARRVHIIEAEVFIPNPEGKETVDHKNRIRDDNRVENLRWATPHEQTENSKCVLERADYGVREVEDRKAYMRAYNKEYYQRNKEYALDYRKKYYAEHKDEIIKKVTEYKAKRKTSR